MSKRSPLLWVVLALFVLAVGLSYAVELYFDWLWFQEVDKTSIFTTNLYGKGAVGAATLLIVFLFLYLNLSYANRGPGQIEIGIPTPAGQITAYRFPDEQVRRFVGLVSAGLGLIVSIRLARDWEVVWRWLNRVDFGISDPVFGRDISFYFFSLPVLKEGLRTALTICLLSLIGVGALYYFKGILRFGRLKAVGRSGRPAKHVSFLAALLFLLLAADASLDRFEVLYSTHGPMYGATYTDLNARLPLLMLLAISSVAAAGLWVHNALSVSNRSAIIAIALYAVVFLAGKVYPSLLQGFVVAPNELGREAPQIQNNILATHAAYGLDKVEERNLSGDKALSPSDIQRNAATIRSIRLWDHEPLLDAFSQIQEIRTYYDFTSVDNDRYVIDGEPQQMMLSARELNSESLPERNWINQHLSYTHGYGLTLGPVNRSTQEGLPVLMVQDIPPRATKALFRVDRPEIYYGELTRRYVVVRTGQKEFDYPAGEENVSTFYEGTGGVPVASFFRKLLFTVYFKDFNIVLSPLLQSESRFLYHRDIRTRVGRAAPFLRLDPDPYLVISEGRLFWIQDAYTVGSRYPYSFPVAGIGNYIRNSVKAVVDAYNGSLDFYVADPDDPVLKVYQKIYRGIFKPMSEIPEDLKRHLRYPELIFNVQAHVYSVYHMTNSQVFYNKEDLWEIPAIGAQGGERVMEPYYTIMRLPQETKEEFILMLPYTPNRKDNLSAWMVGRSDGEHYGKLVVYRFPKQKLVYGPRQIVARINQDAEISRQVSLWDQRGSQVIQGTLMVIPIEEGLLYIRPLYLRADTGKIPELKRVIVAYENKIAMEETLELALSRIFQGDISMPRPMTQVTSVAPPPTGAPATTPDMILQAREAYDRAVQAQRQGEWAKYGEELKRLGSLLEQMAKKP